MPQLSANAQLATYIFAETAKGNGAPFLDAFADHAVWRIIGANTWGRSYNGKEEIMNELIRPLRRRLVGNVTIASRVIDGGDFVVVQANGRNVTRDGVAYENDYCFVLKFDNGKIVSYEEYCDTELVTRVLGDRQAQSEQPSQRA